MSSDFEVVTTPMPNCDAGRRTLTRSNDAAPSPAPSYGFAHQPPPPPPTEQQWTQIPPPLPTPPPPHHDAHLVYRRRCRCSKCWTATCSWLTSAVGVSILLAVYLVVGAVMFMILGGIENAGDAGPRRPKEAAPSDVLTYYDADGQLMDKTLATVDRLWSITEDLNILYRDNWTHLARVEMRRYHEQLVTALRQIMLEERYSFRQTWTFPMSLLYAITLVTTIGYGFYTPTAPLGRGLTTLYSLAGIPLYLFYLSVVGERLARVINRITCTCCCCCCSCCDDDERAGAATPATTANSRTPGSRGGGARRASYRPYSDVTLALQPVTYGNGHALQVTQYDGKASRRRSPTPTPARHQLPLMDASGALPTTDGVLVQSAYCCSTGSLTAGVATPHGSMPGANQVPVVVCVGMIAVFVSLSGLLVVLFEPQLSFLDSLHLTVNLLTTLGFAGNLLPGTALDGQPASEASQASLLVVSCLIVSGTTLLSASFNVLMDSFGHGKAPAANHPPPTPATLIDATTYHHVPSPTR